MSIEVLAKDIRSKAEQIEEKEELAYIEQKKALDDEYSTALKQLEKELDEEYSNEIRLKLDAVKTSYAKEIREVELLAREKVMEMIFSKAYSSLLELSSEEKKEIYSSFFKFLKKSGFKAETVLCESSDVPIVKELASKSGLEIVEGESEGLIFERKAGRERLDFSFKTLLREFFSEREGEIQEMAFGERR